MTAAGLGIALLAITSIPASAQSKAYAPPKAWDNHADLSGIWEAHNRAYVSLEPRTPSLNMPASPGYIVDPADGKIPYKPEALAKRDENYKNRQMEDGVNSCYMPGIPRLMYVGFPFEIFQTAKHVIIASEYAHVNRTIYVDGSKHIEDLEFWDGDSRGHWEGNTLVVDVTNFNDETWFDKAGNYHSGDLHVVERFTRTSDDTLQYEATIEDPKTFTRPWRIRMDMKRNTDPNARLYEYECHSYLEDAATGK